LPYLCTIKFKPMEKLLIHTFEEVHHMCLIYGLKKTYGRFPFMACNPMATPPPVRRKPERTRPLLGWKRNPVNVQYYKNDILILYNADLGEVVVFAKAMIDEYLVLRHPYLKTVWEDNLLKESASGHVIAEISSVLPATDDMP